MSCVRCLDFLWVSSGDARRVFGLLCGSVYLVECFNALRLLSLECRGPLLITASVFSPFGTPKHCSICVQGFLKRYLKVCSFFFSWFKIRFTCSRLQVFFSKSAASCYREFEQFLDVMDLTGVSSDCLK